MTRFIRGVRKLAYVVLPAGLQKQGLLMPKISRVLETALYVADLDKAAAFYADVMILTCIHADHRMRAYDVGGNGDENLLNAANTKLKRPLKDGFRMDGHLSSAKLEKVYLPADGIVIALRASGNLKILYGM